MDDFSIKLLDKVFEKNSLDDECKNLLEKIKVKIIQLDTELTQQPLFLDALELLLQQ